MRVLANLSHIKHSPLKKTNKPRAVSNHPTSTKHNIQIPLSRTCRWYKMQSTNAQSIFTAHRNRAPQHTNMIYGSAAVSKRKASVGVLLPVAEKNASKTHPTTLQPAERVPQRSYHRLQGSGPVLLTNRPAQGSERWHSQMMLLPVVPTGRP